jgi:hypothetical protein
MAGSDMQLKRSVSLHAGLLVLSMIAGCNGSSGGSSQEEQPEPTPYIVLGPGQFKDSIHSAIIGVTYPIYISVPKNYTTTLGNFPVIYSLDAEWRFKNIAEALDENDKDVIQVAIGNLVDEGRRSIDFLLPGAEDYFAFITMELIPYIEAVYRIDSADRTLVGHSYGGVFASIAMLLEDPGNRYFRAFVAQDAAFLNTQKTRVTALEQNVFNSGTALPVTLILSGATGLNGWNATVKWYYNLINPRGYAGLTMTRATYNQSHDGMIAPSFRDAIPVLYP